MMQMQMQIGWNGFPTETEIETEVVDKVYVSAKNVNSRIEKGAHEKKCPRRSSLFGQAFLNLELDAKQFDQTFLKFDAWFESTRGPNAKRRGGKVERKGEAEGNLSFVKVSFAERKKSFRR